MVNAHVGNDTTLGMDMMSRNERKEFLAEVVCPASMEPNARPIPRSLGGGLVAPLLLSPLRRQALQDSAHPLAFHQRQRVFRRDAGLLPLGPRHVGQDTIALSVVTNGGGALVLVKKVV